MVLAALVLAASAADAKKKKPRSPEDLFNPFLGVEHAHWLVGPIFEIADEKEADEFLDLISDQEAEQFIQAFWERRNEGTGFFEDSPEEIFEKRAVEADKQFTEGLLSGRRTDRGTLLILYGEPEETEYEPPGGPLIEDWMYPKDAPEGLDGKKPKSLYRFIEVEGHTVFYNLKSAQRRKHEDRRKPPRPPKF